MTNSYATAITNKGMTSRLKSTSVIPIVNKALALTHEGPKLLNTKITKLNLAAVVITCNSSDFGQSKKNG